MKSDPLADFDSLAAFIPRMAQRKRELSGTVRGIAGLPDRVLERFKTG